MSNVPKPPATKPKKPPVLQMMLERHRQRALMYSLIGFEFEVKTSRYNVYWMRPSKEMQQAIIEYIREDKHSLYPIMRPVSPTIKE